MPGDLPGFTCRLAKVVDTNVLGQVFSQIANFEIKPGLQTQLLQLPMEDIDQAHFYIHVSPAPVDRNPTFLPPAPVRAPCSTGPRITPPSRSPCSTSRPPASCARPISMPRLSICCTRATSSPCGSFKTGTTGTFVGVRHTAGSQTQTQTIDYSDSTIDAESVTVGGRLISSTTKSGAATTFGYDALGRRTETTDSRTGTLITHYDDKGQVDWIEDAADNCTVFGYDPDTGRKTTETNAVNKVTRFAYNDRGHITHTWGQTPYPVRYVYDAYGRMSRCTPIARKRVSTQPIFQRAPPTLSPAGTTTMPAVFWKPRNTL